MKTLIQERRNTNSLTELAVSFQKSYDAAHSKLQQDKINLMNDFNNGIDIARVKGYNSETGIKSSAATFCRTNWL